jgi:pimeloyl-ACP methyl ester carboxylesterase
MGDADPDFPDPTAEAQLIADRVSGEVVVVPDVGHYPQAEAPTLVAEAVLDFLARHG